MNGSVVRAMTGPARPWRMRQWPNDPTIANLIFVDHAEVPTAAEVESALEHARRRGARAVRTSALFPPAAAVLTAAGFEEIDRLALLELTLGDRPLDVGPGHADGRRRHATRPMLAWHHRAAADVDRDAFGPLWGNDAASLRDIRRATPRHRARIVPARGGIAGFAITGAAGDRGYLQRLAVATAHRRAGRATDLVADALDWMVGQGLRTALVNTGTQNDAALALYDRFGFRRLDDELTIAEYRLSPVTT